MRVLTVSAFYESHGGGIEIVAGATARALGRLGHECPWAAASFDELPEDPLVTPVPLETTDPLERWTGLPMPLPSSAARHLLDLEIAKADGIIVHDALYLSSLFAAQSARRHRKPWILVQHIGSIPYTNPLLRAALTGANRFVTRPLLRSAPQTVFISDAVRRSFAEVRWKRTPMLLLNGVDHQTFFPAGEGERGKLRKHFGMSEVRLELLFVGRLVEKKGLATIRALARAKPEWNFSLIGSGPIDPSNWKLPNVRLFGRRTRKEIAELYRAADALVLPSVGEGFPLVIQEAMASGLPVFSGLDSAAADPGARSHIHAIEVDPTNAVSTAERFAKAIEEARRGPDEGASAYALSAYSWDTNAQWLIDRFKELAQAVAAEEPRHSSASLVTS